MPCASTSGSRRSVSCRGPALTGAHQRGSGCPALALSTELRGNGSAGGPRTHCLAIKSRLLIQMSFHGIVVPPARICTCVLRLKRPLLSCLSFGGVVLVPLTRVARVRASPRTGFWDRRVCYSTREAYGPAGASCTRTGSRPQRPGRCVSAVSPQPGTRRGTEIRTLMALRSLRPERSASAVPPYPDNGLRGGLRSTDLLHVAQAL
jgi:hypothetical protein